MFIALGFLRNAVVVASRLKPLQRYEQSEQTQNKKKEYSTVEYSPLNY